MTKNFSTFELIEGPVRIEAILLPCMVSPAQCKTLYKLLPPAARLHPQLATRWDLWGVMATPDWATECAAIITRPQGVLLSFVDGACARPPALRATERTCA